MKNYINPSEAMKELKNGATIKYDQNDGYSKIKKISKDIYCFSVVESNKKPDVFEGGISNVLKTLNSPAFKQGLYVEEK